MQCVLITQNLSGILLYLAKFSMKVLEAIYCQFIIFRSEYSWSKLNEVSSRKLCTVRENRPKFTQAAVPRKLSFFNSNCII